MSNNRKSKFLTPLKSFADFQGLMEMQKAVNALLNGKIAGSNGEVIYSDSNTIWRIGPSSAAAQPVITPFTIYNIPAAEVIIDEPGTGYTEGDILEVSGGTGTAMTLVVSSATTSGIVLEVQIQNRGDYTVQPTYPNYPTGGTGSGFAFSLGTASDNWRSFQVRDGYIGARSMYWLDLSGNGLVDSLGNPNPYPDYKVDNSQGLKPVSNGEAILTVFLDGQGIGNDLSGPNPSPTSNPCAIKLKSDADQLIFGINALGEFVRYGQVLMCDYDLLPNQDPSTAMMSLWAEVIDDATDGFGINVWARMCGGEIGSVPVMSNEVFPSGPNIIPIGLVVSELDYDQATGVITITPRNKFQYYQVLSASVVGRFPAVGGDVFPAVPNAVGKVTYYRGKWEADVLADQVFYPGDIVVDDSDPDMNNLQVSSGTGSIYSYGVYVCSGDHDGVSGTALPFFGVDSPRNDSDRWQKVSSLIIDPPT